MGITKDFAHDYNGQEFNEVVLRPVFQSPNIMDTFRVMDNPARKVQMTIMGEFSKMLKLSGGCTRTEEGTIEMTDRTIESVEIDLANSFCKEILEGLIWEESLKSGSNVFDFQNTAILESVLAQLQKGIQNDIHRITWFAKLNAGNINYDQFDGIWARLIAASGAVVKIGTDAFETTGVLNVDGALELLQKMYDEQRDVLESMDDSSKSFRVTKSIYNNYIKSLTAGAFDGGQTFLINGVPTPHFLGIPLIKETAFGKWQNDGDNPVAADLGKNFGILTVKDNIIIKTDTIAAGKDFNIWYEKKDRKVLIDGAFQLGTNFVHNDLQVVAYAGADDLS